MFSTILMLLVIIFLPRIIVLASSKSTLLNTLGPVFLCYLSGFLLSFLFKAWGSDMTLASDFSSILVLIGMPLILFSADLGSLKKLARPMIFSFGYNTISVIIVAVAAFFIFKDTLPDAQNISGMLIGTYTGGTPNMIAIGKGLNSSHERIMLLQTADMIGGGMYFFMLLSYCASVPEYLAVAEDITSAAIAILAAEKQTAKGRVLGPPFYFSCNGTKLVLTRQ